MNIYSILESLDQVEEKFDMEPTPKSERGKYKGKTAAELRKQYNALKDKEDKTKDEIERMRELAFAVRAKTGWGKVNEERGEPESECCGAPLASYQKDTNLGRCRECGEMSEPSPDEQERMANEAEITPIDHSEDDYDGASVEDIASAITRRMMNAKNFGALVREIDIIDLNDAIEDVARFHEGGDLGTSDVSNMVRDVLKQLGKEDMKLEDVEVNEMIGYYTIYLDGKVVATGVRAMSEKDAINQAYMKMGSASKYTGAGRDSFKAVREEVEVKEQDVEEDNAFNTAAANAKKAGQSHFMFNGKKYKVQMDAETADALTDDVNEDYDKDEYDEEGEMADNQLDVVHDAAQELQDIIDSDDNLPEWVQSKITKAMDYLDTARDYMKSVEDDEESADDVEPPKDEGDEEVEENTVAGAVATTATGEGIFKNASVYESFDSKVENMITEGMNVNISASDQGEPSVSVTATGEDAMALAQLLQLAQVPAKAGPCPSCGEMHEGSCGMNEEDEANSANNTHTYDMHYLINAISGGLNGPKRQVNPNNPGDNPLAMGGIGKDTLNMSQEVTEGEEVKSHLETLYKEFKSK